MLQPSAEVAFAYSVKGEFPDVAHWDGFSGFTGYAYAVGPSQPGLPKTDGDKWNEIAKEMASLRDRSPSG